MNPSLCHSRIKIWAHQSTFLGSICQQKSSSCVHLISLSHTHILLIYLSSLAIQTAILQSVFSNNGSLLDRVPHLPEYAGTSYGDLTVYQEEYKSGSPADLG